MRLKVVFSIFALISLSGCLGGVGNLLPIDGRLLKEANSRIQLGAIYYENPERDKSEPISLDDLCLISSGIHNVKTPTPQPEDLNDIKITATSDGNVKGSGSGSLNFTSLFSFGLSAAANDVRSVSISFSDVKKHTVTNATLSEIRRDLKDPNRNDCPAWINNIKKKRLQIYQVKALYFGDYNIDVQLKSGAAADAEFQVPKVKARVEGAIKRSFKSLTVGEANLFAVELVPETEWYLFDTK